MSNEVEKHWLVKLAEKEPIGGCFDPLENKLAQMFIGAVRHISDGPHYPGTPPRLSRLRDLVRAEMEARDVVKTRRDAAEKEAA